MSYASMTSGLPIRASDDVRPCRVIRATGGATGLTGAETTGATQSPIGISCEGVRRPPGTPYDDGFVAITDEPLCLKGPGQIANAIVGTGGVTGGTEVISDSAGAVIAVGGVTSGFYVGLALDTAAVGEKVQVMVRPRPIGA